MKKSLLLGLALIASASFAADFVDVFPQGDYTRVLGELAGKVNSWKSCTTLGGPVARDFEKHLTKFVEFADAYAITVGQLQQARSYFDDAGYTNFPVLVTNVQSLIAQMRDHVTLPSLPNLKDHKISDGESVFTAKYCPGLGHDLREAGRNLYKHYTSFVRGLEAFMQGLDNYSKNLDAVAHSKNIDEARKIVNSDFPEIPALPRLK